MNTQFERNKLQRELDRSGKQLDFFRSTKNAFGEPLPEAENIGTILGLYHEVNGFNRSSMAGGTTLTRGMASGVPKEPRILCLYESVTECDLRFDDYTIHNGKRYKVVEITNIQEWNIIADISLEVVGNGNQDKLSPKRTGEKP
ncbi:MAG: hypothetical protein LBI05_00145 [Planctomycetaceae bacterium]|jgi:hypothetical protein|nr:hypothetical protein [Planctomycetaceae bacterium]